MDPEPSVVPGYISACPACVAPLEEKESAPETTNSEEDQIVDPKLLNPIFSSA